MRWWREKAEGGGRRRRRRRLRRRLDEGRSGVAMCGPILYLISPSPASCLALSTVGTRGAGVEWSESRAGKAGEAASSAHCAAGAGRARRRGAELVARRPPSPSIASAAPRTGRATANAGLRARPGQGATATRKTNDRKPSAAPSASRHPPLRATSPAPTPTTHPGATPLTPLVSALPGTSRAHARLSVYS